jgi:hypothetical protein
MGHNDVSTTMIYTHVAGMGATGTLSPLDASRFQGTVPPKLKEPGTG